MSVEENDLNDWDENFLNQVLQIELEAISSRNPTQSAAFAAPSSSHLGGGGGGGGGAEFISFSPPRELSQRFVERPEPASRPENDFHVGDPARFPRDVGWRVGGRGGDNREIERLKKELGKVTAQLNQAKNECLELQRERDSKDEQLNRAFLEISSKETEINILKTEREHEVSIPDRSQPTLRLHSKGIGSDQNVLRYPLSIANCSLGTAKGKERRGKTLYNNSKNAVESTFELPPDGQVHGRFMSMSTKIALDYLGDDILSDVAVDVPMQPISSVDAAKVSHLYTTLMKLNSGVVALQDFLGAILDLCNLENCTLLRENVVVTSQSQLTTFVGVKEAINPNITTSEFIELQSAHDKAPFLDSIDEDNMEDGEVDRAQKDTSTFQGVFSGILEGLAECVICAGNGIQEMKLRRHAVIILAFIASSGKSGFEFFLSSRTPQGVNFLELVIRALAMETETETSGLADTQDICKDRHLFMREALILLNRLASNPIYATAVLGALTSSKATLGLTIDVMNRMSRKGRFYDGLKEPQESELIDLAHSFITRIFSFLGESVS
ncbi:hypothetical protein QJS10_CPB11g00096 [Acorus calamus]|uniref:Uncharacterized protein n=1 Tax=Acorus calamus TaxID=4465 RepID=A0AAV9DV60_ACOCL|nr:hypothetical protein QJS10_CPB11g00096 [Acorus calamus]